MNRVLTLTFATALLSAIGCAGPSDPASGEQFKQALEYTAEYPELAPVLEEAIQDDKFDENEYQDFTGRYDTLVNSTNMNKVRDKIAGIKAKQTQDEYAALLAKVRKVGAAQGLTVEETAEGIRLVQGEPQAEEAEAPAAPVSHIVSTDPNVELIDKALEDALQPVVSEED